MDQNVVSLASAVAAIVVSVLAAWLTAKRLVGGEAVAALFARVLEEKSIKRHPIVLVAADAAQAGAMRTTLVQRGFTNVRVEGLDYRNSDAAVVVFAEGLDLVSFSHSSGLSEGLIFTSATIPQNLRPAGDWTFANSPIALFGRLSELIQWQRSVSSK